MLSPDGYWETRQLRAMGSTAEVIVGLGHDRLVDWAVAEIERLEQSWSRFRADSELRCLVARGGTWVSVSADLFDALTRARVLWHRTAGAFDPTIALALESIGYDRSFEVVARDLDEPWSSPSFGPVPGFGLVELDDDAGAVRVPEGVGLDLGGIGKGLAADLVAEGLVLRGAASALVELGGDIRTAGEVPEGGWWVPVRDPFDASSAASVAALGSEAIVTSTSLMRRWRRGGRDLHHIIDPLDGAPAESGVVAVVARGPEAWWAEGLAKAAMILGEHAADALLEGTGVSATLYLSDRREVLVSGITVPACSPH